MLSCHMLNLRWRHLFFAHVVFATVQEQLTYGRWLRAVLKRGRFWIGFKHIVQLICFNHISNSGNRTVSNRNVNIKILLSQRYILKKGYLRDVVRWFVLFFVFFNFFWCTEVNLVKQKHIHEHGISLWSCSPVTLGFI